MNWLPKDKATWGIVLAIVAIVLAFPLSLLANLLTPKIRNWWAERSVAGLKKRIANLESELIEMDGLSPFSREHTRLLNFVQIIAVGAIGIVDCFLGIANFFTTLLPDRLQHQAKTLIGCGIFFELFMLLVIFQSFRQFLNKRSPLHKEAVEKNISELSAKLQSLQKS